MRRELTRRDFIKRSATFAGGAALTSAAFPFRLLAGDDPYRPPIDLAIARGESPADNCLAAVDALGGFSKFVPKGSKVVIKPNPVGTSPPEMAVNTHPDMVEAVVRECFRTGAREVVVLSHDEMRSFTGNGTAAAVERAGGTVKAITSHDDYTEIPVPRGQILRRVEVARDLVDADVFINMPIAKHHGGASLTFTMKNLMGVNWNRVYFHQTDLHRCIAELATVIPHTLVIMDANNVLLTNGPIGPGQVTRPQRVIAGVDQVAVDAFATTFFDTKPERVPHIRIAYELGVGEMDVDRLKVKEFAA